MADYQNKQYAAKWIPRTQKLVAKTGEKTTGFRINLSRQNLQEKNAEKLPGTLAFA